MESPSEGLDLCPACGALPIDQSESPQEAMDRCYDAGWSDMRAIAAKMLDDEGLSDIAGRLFTISKPPSGDK